jgi:hypothetical protein
MFTREGGMSNGRQSGAGSIKKLIVSPPKAFDARLGWLNKVFFSHDHQLGLAVGLWASASM